MVEWKGGEECNHDQYVTYTVFGPLRDIPVLKLIPQERIKEFAGGHILIVTRHTRLDQLQQIGPSPGVRDY